MATMVFTRETLASLFSAAAEALKAPEPTNRQVRLDMDYSRALENFIATHANELGTLAGWLRKKYAAEPTQAKAKALLLYAEKQLAQNVPMF